MILLFIRQNAKPQSSLEREHWKYEFRQNFDTFLFITLFYEIICEDIQNKSCAESQYRLTDIKV